MCEAAPSPLVSVIVPVYKVEAYIEACVRSLMAQTYGNVEFVFVDDGSPDRSMALLERALCPGRRVKRVRQENAGLPRARMAGVEAAEGEYVMHLDSDDWLEPDAVEKLVRCAMQTGADLVYCDFWKEYAHRRKIDVERDYAVADKTLWMKRLYHNRAYGYVWCKFARRSLYEGIFVPRHNMHEDIVFSTQLIFRAQRIAHLRAPLVHYRRDNASSVSRVARAARKAQSVRNMLEFFLHGGPEVSVVRKDLLRKAFWNALLSHWSLFKAYPFLLRGF